MGYPAARIGDMHLCPMVAPGPCPHIGGPIIVGSPNVITGGMPQARVGDNAICCCPTDKISVGSSGVLVNGKPAARLTDSTVHGGKIVTGFASVLIGGGGGGGGGMTPVPTDDECIPCQLKVLQEAAQEHKPFVEILGQ